MLLAALLSLCLAVDGDTLRCGAERIRLLGIDAPEMPGHCRRGRHCAPGDPFASKRALQAEMQGKTLTIRRVGFDHYGRTLAVVYADGADLSCLQLAGGFAVYRGDWDDSGLVARDCPGLAR